MKLKIFYLTRNETYRDMENKINMFFKSENVEIFDIKQTETEANFTISIFYTERKI